MLLGDVRSLKQKRAVVRPLVAELRRRYPGVASPRRVTSTCTGGPKSGWRWCPPPPGNATQVLDECERLVAARPEIELLSRARLYSGR